MKVKELIDYLSSVDQDIEILVEAGDYCYQFTNTIDWNYVYRGIEVIDSPGNDPVYIIRTKK